VVYPSLPEPLSRATKAQAPRTNILGVGVSVINMEDAIRLSDQLIRSSDRAYICATDVHTIIEAQSQTSLRQALNRSFLTTPDGMPLVWVGRIQGHERIDRVYGPDFMLEMCRISVDKDYRHFLYGGKEGVAGQLKDELARRFPGIKIVGTYTPPFRPLNSEEQERFVAIVEEARPDIIWVGLGSPRQERFMADYCGRLDCKLMVGVGAAFDFHTGSVREAPRWLRRSGFQWVHRLIQEPRRLGRRYLVCVPSFIWRIGLQLTRIRETPIEQG
jgi:N-acetylglucosaminyldiphosphoundecaprenol N-acetyl-beta-D-mannosaminyltransferase